MFMHENNFIWKYEVRVTKIYLTKWCNTKRKLIMAMKLYCGNTI